MANTPWRGRELLLAALAVECGVVSVLAAGSHPQLSVPSMSVGVVL